MSKYRGCYNLVGKKFGRLSPVEYIGDDMWLCKCDCGKEYKTRGYNLRSGRVHSCGCLRLTKNKPALDDRDIEVIVQYSQHFPSICVAMEAIGKKKINATYAAARIKLKTGLDILKFPEFVQLGQQIGLPEGHKRYGFTPTEKQILYDYLTERQYCSIYKKMHWGYDRFMIVWYDIQAKYDLMFDCFETLTSVWNEVKDINGEEIEVPDVPDDIVCESGSQRTDAGDRQTQWSYTAPYERDNTYQSAQ